MLTFRKTMTFTIIILFFFMLLGFANLWSIWSGNAGNYNSGFTQLAVWFGCLPGNEQIDCSNLNATTFNQAANQGATAAFGTTIAGAISTGAIIGILFPNMWAIFAPVTLVLLGMLAMPIGLITNSQIPLPIRFGFFAIYALGLFALLGWYKGGDAP